MTDQEHLDAFWSIDGVRALVKDFCDDLTYGRLAKMVVGRYTLSVIVDCDDLDVLDRSGDVANDESYGRTAWVDKMTPRPPAFSGAARKIRDGNLWWEPPSDHTGDVLSLQRELEDLLEYGYRYISASLSTPSDCCGLELVFASLAMGGLSPSDANYSVYVEELEAI